VTPEEYTEDPSPKSTAELDALVDDVNVVKGVGGELIRILQPLGKLCSAFPQYRCLEDSDVEKAREGLEKLFNSGVRSLAVVLLHSYTLPDHELAIGKLAKEIGFTQISLSSQLLPMIKAVSRGHSAAADAYLSPVVQKYIEGFRSGFLGKLEDTTRGARCEFMQSDGGLVGWQRFNGLRAILSGPAGGVVGFSRTCYDEDNITPCIGFDMGGKYLCRSSGSVSNGNIRYLNGCQQIRWFVDPHSRERYCRSDYSNTTIRHHDSRRRRWKHFDLPERSFQCWPPIGRCSPWPSLLSKRRPLDSH
jgi:hypothetical protein